MIPTDPQQSRQFFLDVWTKYQQQSSLQPLEEMVLEVILAHPEYHHYLSKKKLNETFFPEQGNTNPFLHFGLHIALKEQIKTNRPEGIVALYQLLQPQYDWHDLEHRMMDCLAESLWQAQRYHQLPDEMAYLNCLHHIQNQK